MGISQFLTVAAKYCIREPRTVRRRGCGNGSHPRIRRSGAALPAHYARGHYFYICRPQEKRRACSEEKKRLPAPVKAAAPKAPVVEAGIPGEVVAAIAAAVACMDGGERYTLRSVKRTRVSGRSAWGQAGVVAYTEPF